jgi:hypothetical protein
MMELGSCPSPTGYYMSSALTSLEYNLLIGSMRTLGLLVVPASTHVRITWSPIKTNQNDVCASRGLIQLAWDEAGG